MGESWKYSHSERAAVLKAAHEAVKQIPDAVKAAANPDDAYAGPERREKTRKRWSIGLSFEMYEKAGK